MKIDFNIEYYTRWGEELHVSVSQGQDAPESVRLHTDDGRMWRGSLEVRDGARCVEYRYYVTDGGVEVRREVGCPPHVPGEAQDWWREPMRVAGVAIPVFALRSEGSQGVGDFGDLSRMVDWAYSVGMKAVQVLPVGDTTAGHVWTDSYPYNLMSVNALHPQYIDLRQMAPLPTKREMNDYERECRRLNRLPQVDYEGVEALKQGYLRRLYEVEGERTLRSAPYRRFAKANEDWLITYAVFSFLRDAYGTPDYTAWPEHGVYNDADVAGVAKAHASEVGYYCYVQFHLDRQLSAVGNHARRRGIVLKGDIPIGVSRRCVETWQHPHYFNLDQQTGAPPDFFSRDGQNWGFPTYNWSVMEKDGYGWWTRRMRRMSQYFSAYRIDHILGFFRIWEIPRPHHTGLLGHFSPAMPLSREEIEGRGVTFVRDMYLQDLNNHSLFHPRISARSEDAYGQLSDEERRRFDALYEDFFYHRHNHFWYNVAMHRLPPLVHATQMIACGEDLGMVPECVGWVMHQLGILSLEIQSMPKEMGLEFGILDHNPRLSVCTISSHDTASMRGWWEEDAERTQRYYNQVLGMAGVAPAKMPADVCRRVVSDHLCSPSALCILTLQDWLAIDSKLRLDDPSKERINIPANPRHYWRYRMHLTLEQLIHAKVFNKNVKQMIETTRP